MKSTITSAIYTKTLRGTLTGTFTLSNAAGSATFKGGLSLVTQGRPAAGAAVPGRGWINALSSGPDEGATPPAADDSLIANVEFKLSTTGATGQFGDAAGGGTLGFPDFSVVTNVAPRALDGVC
jgi:hypothetical protein